MINRISFENELGIPLWLERGKLFAGGDYEVEHKESLLLADIKSQTINDDICYPEYIGDRYKLKILKETILNIPYLFNILKLSGTLLGIEFAKTRGRYTKSNHSVYLQGVSGSGFVIIQDTYFDPLTFAFRTKEVHIVYISQGTSLLIPPHYGYVIVNKTLRDLILLEVINEKIVQEEVFDNHKGAAFYIIYKNSRPEIVTNPYFSDSPNYKRYTKEMILKNKKLGSFTVDEIKQMLLSSHKAPIFSLLCSNNFNINQLLK